MTQIPNKENYFNNNSAENGIFILGLAIGGFLTGIVYIAIFLPMSYHSSMKMGLDPFNIILFADIPSNLLDILVSQKAPDFFNLQLRPILFALGNLYGINGIILAFMFISIKTNKLITFTITASGIVGGYFLTLYLAGNLFKIIVVDAGIKKLFYIKISYILLAYYIFEGLKDLVRKYRFRKYDIYFDGLYGIVSTILLMKGFNESIASALSGPLFLLSQFLSTSIIEQTLGRVLYAIIEISKQNGNFENNGLSKFMLNKIVIGLWQKMKEYKGEEVELPFPPLQMWSFMRQYRAPLLIFSCLTFIVFSVFPIFTFMVYQFIIKGLIR